MKHRREEKWESKLGTSSFDPLEVIELQDAIRQRIVVARIGGRQFELTYYSAEDGEKVHYSPLEGFVPSGNLDIKRFLED
jgi:hypothetical protein